MEKTKNTPPELPYQATCRPLCIQLSSVNILPLHDVSIKYTDKDCDSQ